MASDLRHEPTCPVCGMPARLCVGASKTAAEIKPIDELEAVLADTGKEPGSMVARYYVEDAKGRRFKMSEDEAERYIAANQGAKMAGKARTVETIAGPADPTVEYDAGSSDSVGDTVVGLTPNMGGRKAAPKAANKGGRPAGNKEQEPAGNKAPEPPASGSAAGAQGAPPDGPIPPKDDDGA